MERSGTDAATDAMDPPLSRGLLWLGIRGEGQKHCVDHVHDAVASLDICHNHLGRGADTLDENLVKNDAHSQLFSVERRQHLSVTEVLCEGDGRNDVVGEHFDERLDRDVIEALGAERSEQLDECIVRRREDGEFCGRVCDGIEESSGDDGLDKDGEL